MKKIVALTISALCILGCSKTGNIPEQDQTPQEQEQKDDLIGTSWTASYNSGEKQYIMEFLEDGAVQMYLAELTGAPISDIRKGTYQRDGDNLTFSLDFYQGYMAAVDIYTDHQRIETGKLSGKHLEIGYYRIFTDNEIYGTHKFVKL